MVGHSLPFLALFLCSWSTVAANVRQAPTTDSLSESDLQRQKLQLEVEKLRLETSSELQRPSTWLNATTAALGIAAWIGTVIYSRVRYERAQAEARHAQADKREAEMSLERLRPELATTEQRLAIAIRDNEELEQQKSRLEREETRLKAKLYTLNQSLSTLARHVFEASESLQAAVNAELAETLDLNDRAVDALRKLGATLVVNRASFPIRIRLTAEHRMKPIAGDELLSNHDLGFVGPIETNAIAVFPMWHEYVTRDRSGIPFRLQHTYLRIAVYRAGDEEIDDRIADKLYNAVNGVVVEFEGKQLKTLADALSHEPSDPIYKVTHEWGELPPERKDELEEIFRRASEAFHARRSADASTKSRRE